MTASASDPRPHGAVYFPYINAPKNDWFVRTLLFWDDVACIVPHEYNPHYGNRRRRVRPDGRTPQERFAHTIELADAGLVRILEPELPANKVWPFVEDFIAMVEQDSTYGTRCEWASSDRRGITVHRGKLGEMLLHHLERVGLARQSNKTPWAYVEPETARLFMAFLASYLGDTQPRPLRPVTDDGPSYKAIKRLLTPRDALGDPEVRDVILKGALCAPAASEVDPYDLANFKHRREQELRQFRRYIDSQVRQLAAIGDPQARLAQTNEIAQDLAERVAELEDLMRKQGWKNIKRATLQALTVSAPPSLALLGHPTTAVASGLTAGLAATAYQLLRPAGASFADDPLAYAVSVRRLLSA